MNRRAASSPDAQTFRPLSGRRLFLARLGWLVVFVVTIGLFAAIIPAYYDSLVGFSDPEHDTATVRANLEAADVSIERFATYLLGVSVASAVVWVVVGTLIFWRRSDNWIALFASLCLIVFGTFGLNESGVLALPDQAPALWLPVRLLALFSNVGIYALVLIFPNGRFVPRWTRWAVVLFAVHDVFFFLFPDSIFNLAESFPPLDFAVLATVACVAIGSQLYRYRHVSAPVERQQTKWVVFGMVSAGVGALIFEVPIAGSPLDQFGPLYALAIHAGLYGSLLLLPLSIGVAILRYRLWDVDAVINRTLVYGALSAIVVALYTLIVVALGELFQARADLAVSLVATGVVVVLFAPLRERLQRGTNRLMYGERDDPYAVLSRLGRRLEVTIAPKAVLETIVETIAQALKVPYAGINLRQDGAQIATAAEYGTPKGEPLILPLVYQRETVGHLIVASRAPGEIFSPADLRLLEDLARQVEVAVHAVRLTQDLQHSRERLVTTREEERRRLRRDLHDGLGPTLGYLTLGLDTACRLFAQDPKGAEALLRELKAQTQEAISEVRRLVYGLRPPALDDLGLIAAIRQQAANHGPLAEDLLGGKGSRWNNNGLVFSVEASEDLPLLPAAVEVACYRIAQEAIANATRHSGAGTCHVSLSLEEANGSLELDVVDDGIGVAEDRKAGVGMSSMRERAEELGGTLIVETLPEGGTRILSRLPLSTKSRGVATKMNPPEPSAQEAPTRVLLADDHTLFRHGLKAMLASIAEYEVVGEAATGEEAVEKAAKAQPEIVLMDIQMPQMNGIEATRRIVEANPHTRVVMLTMFGDNDSVFAAMRAGARGYVLKGADEEEVLKVVGAVAGGEAHFGPEIAERLMSFFTTPPRAAPPSKDFPELTSREVEVLDLIARGRSNTEIAMQLYVSPKTVRNHISSIFTKLQVADRAQAIVRAREAGLGREGAV